MADLEDRLRRLLADAAAGAVPGHAAVDGWGAIRDRLDDAAPSALRGPRHFAQEHAPADPVPAPAVPVTDTVVRPRRPRRMVIAIGAAAAVLAAVVVVAVASGYTRRAVTVGVAPGGTAALTPGTLPRFLFGTLPAGFTLDSGQDVGPQSFRTGAPPGRIVVLDGAGPGRSLIVIGTPMSGPVPSAPSGTPGTGGHVVTVHGQAGQLQSLGAVTKVTWFEDGAAFTVAGTGVGSGELAAVADAVTPDASAAAGDFSVGPLPDGLSVGQTGTMADAMPRALYTLTYVREDLNAPANDSVTLTVQEDGMLQGFMLLGTGGAPVTVRGHPGELGQLGPAGGGQVMSTLDWEEAPGVGVSVRAIGLSAAELRRVAEGLTQVSDPTWLAAVGSKLEPTSPNQSTTTNDLVAQGTLDHVDWRLYTSDPSAPGESCLDLETSAGQGSETCSSGGTERQNELFDMSVGAAGLYAGLVPAGVVTVEVRTHGSATMLGSFGTETAQGRPTERAVVLALPASGPGVDLVGLDAAGHVVATTTETPPPPTSGLTPLDPTAVTRGPVLAGGQLDGHPWTVQAAVLGTPSGGAASLTQVCAVVTYAGGAAPSTCTTAPTGGALDALVAEARRSFVVAIVGADVTAIRATFSAGASQDVPTVAVTAGSGAGPRVAVVPIPSTATLTSVAALDDGGRVLTTVTGSVPGGPGQPWTLGGSGGESGGGSFSSGSSGAQPATTAVPAG